MPRASSTDSDTPKRAPRRRVAAPRAPRKTATRSRAKVVAEIATEATEAPVALSARRKAPTKLPLSPASPVALYEASRAKKSLFVSGSLLMLGLAIAAGIGYSDKGVINTAAVIKERNTQLAAGVTSTEPGATTMVIPVQNSAAGPIDGGLVSSGEVPPLVPSSAELSASSTEASTTEAVSTTTDEVAEEVEAETVAPVETEEAAPVEAASESSE